MTQKLDLAFRVGDKIRPRYITVPYPNREIERFDENGDMRVGGKIGPKYHEIEHDIVVQNADKWVFCCHHHGAPFEKIMLDEEGNFADGEQRGLAHALAGQFYTAGGPYVSQPPGHNGCRHLRQAHEFEVKNCAAFVEGWKRGQERAKMKTKLNFKKPLRTVKTHYPVTYVGPLGEQHVVAIDGSPPPIMINAYGKVDNPNDPYGTVIENAPEAVVTKLRFNHEGRFIGANFNGATARDDIVVEVSILEGVATAKVLS